MRNLQYLPKKAVKTFWAFLIPSLNNEKIYRTVELTTYAFLIDILIVFREILEWIHWCLLINRFKPSKITLKKFLPKNLITQSKFPAQLHLKLAFFEKNLINAWNYSTTRIVINKQPFPTETRNLLAWKILIFPYKNVKRIFFTKNFLFVWWKMKILNV